MASSALTDLMSGLATDCPPKPFGGAEEYESSPDGDVMVLTCRRVTEAKKQPDDMAWSSEGTYKANECTYIMILWLLCPVL